MPFIYEKPWGLYASKLNLYHDGPSVIDKIIVWYNYRLHLLGFVNLGIKMVYFCTLPAWYKGLSSWITKSTLLKGGFPNNLSLNITSKVSFMVWVHEY